MAGKQLLVLVLSALSLFGCAKARMGSEGHAPPPNRKLECGVQTILTVFEDGNHDQVFSPQEMTGVVLSYGSTLTAAQNYGYRGKSAHPTYGPKGEALEASVFFYSGPEGLSFNFFLDKESASQHSNRADVFVTVSHNNHKDHVLLSDEPGEFRDVDADLDSTFYVGTFDYRMTTDGGIIGPLGGSDFEVHFKIENPGALKTLRVHSSHGGNVTTQAMEMLVRYANVDPCVF